MNTLIMTTRKETNIKPLNTLKLTVDLVPESSMHANVRSHVKRDQWEEIKKSVYKRSGNRCEVCGEKGPKVNVECQEIWEYDDRRMVQKLVDIVAMCPRCREVKHMSYAERKGRMNEALQHFRKVNGLSQKTALNYIQEAFSKWRDRNLYRWQLDLSYLKTLVKTYS